MKKFLLFLFSFLVGAVLFIWIVRDVGWEEIKLVFTSFSLGKGLVILILTFLTILIGIWKWRFILRNQGYNVPFAVIIKSYFAGYSISFLAPMMILGGEVFRGYSLKEKESVPWTKAMGSVVIDRISEATLCFITIIAGVLYFLLRISLPPKNLGIILALTLISFGGLTAIFYFKSFKKESIIKFFTKRLNMKLNEPNSFLEIEKEVFDFFRPRKKVMWESFGLSFLRVLANLLRMWLLIIFFGKNIGILSAFSVLAFYYFVIALPIPAALGSHEVIQSFSFNALGLGANTGTALALIIRVVDLIVALIGVLFFLGLSFHILENSLIRKIKNLIKIN